MLAGPAWDVSTIREALLIGTGPTQAEPLLGIHETERTDVFIIKISMPSMAVRYTYITRNIDI